MKYINLAILGLFAFMLTSCSKDDNVAPPTVEVNGSWKLEQGVIDNGTVVIDMQGFPVALNVSGRFVEIGENNRINLKDDHTYNSVSDNIVIELSINVMGTVQTETFPVDNLFSSGTWERNDNKLILKDDQGVTMPYNIKSLTNEEMQLSTNMRDMALPSDFGDLVQSTDIDVHLTLKRM